jgi:hypothetical protein
MPELIIGQRYLTKRGLGTLMALTPYQAQVRLDEGDDVVWLQRAELSEAPPSDDEQEPTILELLDSACSLIEVARAKLAAGERVV